MGVHSALLLLIAAGHLAQAAYDPTYGQNWSTSYNVNSTFNRFPDTTVIREADYQYFISDLNFDTTSGHILLGAADRLYLLSTELSVVDQYDWATDPSLLSMCMDSNVNLTCRNHIRVYQRLPSDEDLLLVCGTQSAEDPQCRIIDFSLETFGTAYNSSDASDGIVSFYPEFSGFGEFRQEDSSDDTYFTAGLFGETNTLFSISYQNISLTDPSDPNTLVTTQQFRTIASNNNWLRTPVTFVDYYRADYPTTPPSDYQFYFVFLRENLFDEGYTESDIVYTRIVRICRNDPGSILEAGGARHFTSYIKARIYCERTVQPGREFFGSIAYQYNDMTSMVFNEVGRYYEGGEWKQMMYGAFSGPTTGPLGTALCVYRADDSSGPAQENNLFNIFRFDFELSAGGTAVNSVFRCDENGRGDTEAQNQVLISRDVQQVGDDPLLVMQDLHITQIALDSVCVVKSTDSTKCVNQDVLFLGTDTGRIIKVVFGQLDGETSPVIAEELTLDDNRTINDLKIMDVGNSTYLYATTDSKVYQLPLDRCSRHLGCSDCLSSRDPYCVWNSISGLCERTELTAVDDAEGDVPTTIYQSVHSGPELAGSLCPSGEAGFSSATFEVNEGAGFIVLTIIASAVNITDLEIYTADGTATANSDYNATVVPIVFPAGENQTSVQISIVDDSVYEGSEYFTVGLRTTRSGTGITITQQWATITIVDNDVVRIQFRSTEISVTEGSCPLELEILKSGATLYDVVVNVSTVATQGTATVNEDYEPTEVEVHFSPELSQQSFVITVLDDEIQEPAEIFVARLELGNGQSTEGVELGQDVTINVTDDDTVNFRLSSDEVTVGEADGTVTLTIFKSGDTVLTTSTEVLVSSDSAIGGVDYTPVPSTILTYLPNDSEKQVTINIIDDTALESLESLTVSLISTGESGVGTTFPNFTTVFITDNDGVEIALEQSEYTTTEGSGMLEVALVKTNVSDVPVTVLLTTISDSATAGEDYTEVSQVEVVFQPAEDRVTYQLLIEGDVIHEAEETFLLRLSQPSGDLMQTGVQLGRSEAVITVIDDDDVEIGFVVTEHNVSESCGRLTVSVERVGLSAIPISFSVSTASITATGQDYSEINQMQFAIRSELSSVALTVEIEDDSIHEQVEEFQLSVTLVNPGRGELLSEDTASIAIWDNDDVTVGFERAGYNFNESVGTVVLNLVKTGSSETNISVTITTIAGSALDTDDYTGVGETVVIGAAETEVQLPITISNDDVLEGVESFLAEMSLTTPQQGVVIGLDTATLEIVDDDSVTVEFEMQNYTVLEGDGYVDIAVQKVGTSDIPVSVLLSTSSSGTASAPGDYSPLMATPLTFEPSEDRVLQRIWIAADTLYEADEMLTVSLTLPSDQKGVVLGTQTENSVTITDDDVLVLRLGATEYRVSEGGGSVGIRVVKEGNAEQPVTATLTTSDGAAVGSADYTPANGVEMVFAPNISFLVMEIAITEDSVLEEAEDFSVTLTTTEERVRVEDSLATVIITDDDSISIGLESPSYLAAEGTSVEVCAMVVSGVLERDVNVSLSTSDLTARGDVDYTPVDTTLVFSQGVSRVCLNVVITQDEVFENEEEIQLALATSDDGVFLTTRVATIGIMSNDSVTVGFEVSSYNTSEEVGVVSIGVTKAGSSEVDIAVVFQTSPVTAAASMDYFGLESTVTFTPTQTVQTVNITVINDEVFEAVETFVATLSTSMTGVLLDIDMATISIADNDRVTFLVDPVEYSVDEGDGSDTVTVRKEGSSAVGTSILFTAANGSAGMADYTSTVGLELVFAPGTTLTVVQIGITNDSLLEGDEDFEVRISTSQERVRIERDTAVVTITDDDTVEIGVFPDVYTVSEADGMVTITLRIISGQTAVTIPINIATDDGTAVSQQDYTTVQQVVQFGGSNTEQTVSIPIVDNEIYEPSETFALRLSLPNSQPGVTIGQSLATVEIIDDDELTVGFGSTEYTVMEDGCFVQFEISKEGQSQVAVTLRVQTRDGTAVATTDYMELDRVLTIDASDTSVTVEVYIINDDLTESTEQFSLQLSLEGSWPRVTLSSTTAEVNIVENDNIGPTGNVGETPIVVVGAVSSDDDCVLKDEGTAAAVITILVAIIVILLILVLVLLFVLHRKYRNQYKVPHSEAVPIALEPLGVANVGYVAETPVEKKEGPFGVDATDGASPQNELETDKDVDTKENAQESSEPNGGDEHSEEVKKPLSDL